MIEANANPEEVVSTQVLLSQFFVELFNKFDQINFLNEKISFIFQITSSIIAFKIIELKNVKLKGIFLNKLQIPDFNNRVIEVESSVESAQKILNFIQKSVNEGFDPTFSFNEISFYVEVSENQFKLFFSVISLLQKGFDFEITDEIDNLIHIFSDSFNSHFKLKKDLLIQELSEPISSFLINNSLKPDLKHILGTFHNLKTIENDNQKKIILEKIYSHRIIDPNSTNGSVLIYAFKEYLDFYHELLKLLQISESNQLTLDLTQYLFGMSGLNITEQNLSSLICIRHIFGIAHDSEAVFLTKLNLFIAINSNLIDQNLNKTNLALNIVKGNILLGYKENKDIELLNNLLQDESNRELSNKISNIQILYQNFATDLKSFDEINSIKSNILQLISTEYSKILSELKIKSDLQLKLPVIHPNIEFFYLNKGEKAKFSIVIGPIPSRQKYNLTTRKLIRYHYPELSEDFNEIFELFFNEMIQLVCKEGYFSVLTNRNILYHAEYSKIRDLLLKSHKINYVIDLGDYKLQKGKSPLALLVLENKDVSSNNIFSGLNLQQTKQSIKDNILLDFKSEDLTQENIIYREITQEEFLLIKSFRFYIKQPSKWFFKFSAVETTLNDLLESFEDGVKIGENKVFYVGDQKVKELQLEPLMLKNALKGKDFKRYSIPENYNLIYVPTDFTEEKIQTESPNTWKYLLEQKDLLSQRPRVKKGSILWYQINEFEKVTETSIRPPKLLLVEKANEPIAVFDSKGTIPIWTTVAVRFQKQVKFRDYFKILVWINSLIVKAGYIDLTQDSKTQAKLSRESIRNLAIPMTILRDEALTSNVQQIVQMILANKFAFNPHLLLLEFPEEQGKFHPIVLNFLFEKVYEVMQKKMKNLLDKTIKLSDIALIEVKPPNKKKKVEFDFFYPIFQDYAKSILVLKNEELEITIKLKPRTPYTLPWLQLFLAHQNREMIQDYLKQNYTKPETLELILASWPIPELQMKHVMETFNFVRFQKQNLTNFFTRTRNMLLKVETQIATHYGLTPEEIQELLSDKELIEY
jgi:hypothetical protein